MAIYIYVLEGNLQWNSWVCKTNEYLKGSIVKFKLNLYFQNIILSKYFD